MSQKSVIGHTDDDLPWAMYTSHYQQRDQEAMEKRQSDIFEPVPINKHMILTFRTLKRAIHDETGTVIGVLGQMSILSKNDIGEALSAIHMIDQKTTATSQLSPKAYQYRHYQTEFKLTRRESECLFLLIRAKSTKDIARFLELSPRTVETYIEQIKNKMNVSTRTEIIAKAIEMGMLTVIPHDTILVNLSKNIHRWKDFLLNR